MNKIEAESRQTAPAPHKNAQYLPVDGSINKMSAVMTMTAPNTAMNEFLIYLITR